MALKFFFEVGCSSHRDVIDTDNGDCADEGICYKSRFGSEEFFSGEHCIAYGVSVIREKFTNPGLHDTREYMLRGGGYGLPVFDYNDVAGIGFRDTSVRIKNERFVGVPF